MSTPGVGVGLGGLEVGGRCTMDSPFSTPWTKSEGSIFLQWKARRKENARQSKSKDV